MRLSGLLVRKLDLELRGPRPAPGLEPLRKALTLPRVNLFIADDVGLGKTIEAGLIMRELLLRQKVQRVVVVAPPIAPERRVRCGGRKYSRSHQNLARMCAFPA